ncbi:SRPBCC domain-containing protein [Tenggerimyces flavus]|uniref:SRPBCC domain-containing protein n=1 Tax=Tenggerimyces flavus TaxID=1708749 RepID=A0ABV7YF64_9ACTN|nr:SRPBCC domain-containing protein [Tenggerimyces flavus]MBM7787856.1 uncharacterized protein YndB with AHSA1/START domain [Tenggerimyces flavus]
MNVKVHMGIRRPPADVFKALVDPEVTTRFWFTHSTGPLEPGAKVEWRWEMYDVSSTVLVREFEQDRRLVFDWGDGTTAEFLLTPWEKGTFVVLTETGHQGTPEEIAETVAGSTGGFSFMLAACKALLEHDVELRVVLDHIPPGVTV